MILVEVEVGQIYRVENAVISSDLSELIKPGDHFVIGLVETHTVLADFVDRPGNRYEYALDFDLDLFEEAIKHQLVSFTGEFQMTVGRLIDMLDQYDPSTLVVMAKDAEGNSFSPARKLDAAGYVAHSAYSGELSQQDADEGVACVVLWPVN